MTAIVDRSGEAGKTAKTGLTVGESAGRQASPEPRGHTGDQLATARTDLERSIQFHDEAKPLDPWIEIHVDDARCILSALRTTQADNVLRQLRNALTIAIAEPDIEIVRGQLEQNRDALDAALKASPTTEPNPEGMKVAEREKLELWFFRECNEGTRRHLFSLFGLPVDEIRSHGTERIALRHILSTLTSASNLSLIGPE